MGWGERLRLRGGLLSGSLLLAGFSAVLLSGLAVVGLRTVAGPDARPDHVTLRQVSGEVSVPDAPDGATTATAAHHQSRPATLVVPRTVSSVATASSDGAGAATSPTPAPRPVSSPTSGPTKGPGPRRSSPPAASPTSSPSHGRGHAHGHGHTH